jgi:hypothetical protein
VLDSFSHFPHTNKQLVHISRVVGRYHYDDLNQLTPEIVSISSEGLCLYCQYKNSLLGSSAASEDRVYLMD